MGSVFRNTISLTFTIEVDTTGRRTIQGGGSIVAGLGRTIEDPDISEREFIIRGRIGERVGDDQFRLIVTEADNTNDTLFRTSELADRLGIQPDSVRQRMRRWGIEHVEGWPASRVLPLLEGREADVG